MKKELTQSKSERLKVSVVVPNFNYEQYLPERLSSIINQTNKPYEIIFLDDASNDKSVMLARNILKKSSIKHKIIKNEETRGCFKQWVKGLKEAEGDLVWFAEADDVCELNLIESLVHYFNDQEVNLVYSQSQIINQYSKKINYEYTQYTVDLSKRKWLSSYCNDGRQEMIDGLAIKNTIPNASSVLMRKSALEGIEDQLSEYTICGDWFTYAYVLKRGKIAFCPQKINYHRRHEQCIVMLKERSISYYLELIKVKQYIANTFDIPSFIKEKFLGHIELEYRRLGCKGFDNSYIHYNHIVSNELNKLIELTNKKINSINYLQSRKKILFVTPDLEVGGGQMLVIRLSNFFAPYHDVYIYNTRPWLKEKHMIDLISSNVKLVNSSGNPDELKKFIDKEKINIINSHIWWADKIVFKALQKREDINWVISMHGCYEALLKNPQWDNEFNQLVTKMLNRANQIIFATQKNTEILQKLNIENKKVHKIYYGYSLQSIPSKSRDILGIQKDDIVFGLISRPIKEKGWEESIKALIEIRKSFGNTHLILVGKGDFARHLKDKYKNFPFIHFITEFSEPSEWIGWLQTFDVALLPSYFISESLPNSIIEYLAYNKPIIATDIGEIKYMIQSDTIKKDAGILLRLNQKGIIEVNDIIYAMKIMLTNKNKLNDFKQNTNLLFKQFQMENFAANYFSLF